MNWDEMIDYIKKEKIKMETENSKTTIAKTPSWYKGNQINSGNETDTILINYKIIIY